MLGALVAIVYLLIPHQDRPWLRHCRYLVFAWVTGFAIYTVLYTKARLIAPSFGVGLLSAWSVVWVGAILICNDAQADFMRIEKMRGVFGAPTDKPKEKDTINHTESPHEGISKHENGDVKLSLSKATAGPSDRDGQFAWQPYPLTPFIERLDWVLDLFCNFRGAGWNWRTSALPPPPKWIQEQLRQNCGPNTPKHSFKTHAGQAKSYTTRSQLIQANLKALLKGYLALDALKTLMMWDPYFWGLVDHTPSPSSHLPLTLYFLLHHHHPRITHIYHLLLSMLAVKTALETIFTLGPLASCILPTPYRHTARTLPFLYPTPWGPFSTVLDHGLAGWWSNWWHQTFRFALDQPSRVLREHWDLHKHSLRSRLLQLVTAFTVSGILHATASSTISGPSRPWSASFAFFAVQAPAILLEGCVRRALESCGVGRRVPRWGKRVLTLIYVHVWFYSTAHLLCDDFARGGIWLFEPVPVSVFRGLGFGADERDGWWCWGGPLVRWHRGERWWDTGIAF